MMNETFALNDGANTDENTAAFAQSVLTKILGDYRAQNAADPLSANRILLDTGVAELRRVLDSGMPLTDELCRDALTVLWQRWDFGTLAEFLSRYLAEPNLSASHRAWAHLHLANALALTGSAAGAVLAHEAWEREGHDDVCLLESFPYNPAPQNTTEPAYRKDEVALLFLSQSAAFARSYAAVWRGADYRRKVDALFKARPATSDANRLRRFFTLRMVYAVYEQTGDNRGIADAIAQMFALADDTANPEKQSELRLKALSHTLDRARKTGDDSGFIEALAQSHAILAAAGGAAWVHGERHNLAHQLTMAHQYAEALPLWETNRAAMPHGHANGWGWLQHAATQWAATGDRGATLDLLRHARAAEARDLRDLFQDRPEFAEVLTDAEFLAAVSPAD